MEWIYCETEAHTFEWGVRLGRLVSEHLIVSLRGKLGAGKTVFARGVGRGLGVRTQVQSPSYAIIQTHEGGRLPFWHADFYRLADESEADYLGLETCLEGDGLLLVEWCERVTEISKVAHLEVHLEDYLIGRRLRFVAQRPEGATLVEQLCSK